MTVTGPGETYFESTGGIPSVCMKIRFIALILGNVLPRANVLRNKADFIYQSLEIKTDKCFSRKFKVLLKYVTV